MSSIQFFRLTILLVMSQVISSKNFGQDVFATFKTDDVNSYDAGKSFANWFVSKNFQNQSEFNLACLELGADVKTFQGIHKIDDPDDWFETFQGEMNYYYALDSMFWKKVGEAVLSNKANIENRLKERISGKGFHAWIVYGPAPDECDLWLNNMNQQYKNYIKWKVNGKIQGRDGFTNKKGKDVKVQLGFIPDITHIKRLDDHEVIITFSSGKSAFPWQVVLPSKKKHKPFIRKFNLSEYAVVEGRHSAITWEVYGVEQVFMNHTIGIKPPKGQVIVAPEATADYELHAKNDQGEVMEKLQLIVERIYVKSIDVTFYCGNKKDNKRPDQVVHIRVLNDHDELMAEGIYGEKIEFTADKAEGSYFGPFHPEMSTPILKKQLLHGKFQFTLEGNTADHWEFSPLMIIHYTDGTKNSFFGYENQEMDTDAAPLEFKF